MILNCLICILANEQQVKSDVFLNSVPKKDLPRETYHIDIDDLLLSTCNNYKQLLVINALTGFIWFYPVRRMFTSDDLDKLKLQQKTFGYSTRIICGKGTVLTSKEKFDNY